MTSRPRAAEVKQTVEEMRLEISHPSPLLLLPCVAEVHFGHAARSVSWHLLGFTEAAAAIQHHYFHLNSVFTGSLVKPGHRARLRTAPAQQEGIPLPLLGAHRAHSQNPAAATRGITPCSQHAVLTTSFIRGREAHLDLLISI